MASTAAFAGVHGLASVVPFAAASTVNKVIETMSIALSPF